MLGRCEVMGWGIEIMLSVGRFVSGLPGAVSVLSAWPIVALVLLSLGGLWIAIWRHAWRWFGLVPMLAGVAAAYAAPGPDILVARDALTVAVRGSDGLLRFVRPPKDDYSASEWLKRDGDERDSDAAVATPDNGVRLRRIRMYRQSAERNADRVSARGSTRWRKIAPMQKS